jgi:hypothetical protein
MAGTLTSIRLDTHLADEAAKVLGVKSRTEAVHVALRFFALLMRPDALGLWDLVVSRGCPNW